MSYNDAPTDAPTDARLVRPHEWTVDKQQAFLDALAGHGRVVEAAAAVGMSAASAYRLRARVPAFAFGWRAATALAYERLRDLALDRATNGVVTPRFYHGAAVSETVRYSDRLLLGLLAHLKPEAGTDPATGKRRAAAAASELWAAAVDAYDTARETGEVPVKPYEPEDGPRPKLSREKMIALILEKAERLNARDEQEALDNLADPRPPGLWGGGDDSGGHDARSPHREINKNTAGA